MRVGGIKGNAEGKCRMRAGLVKSADFSAELGSWHRINAKARSSEVSEEDLLFGDETWRGI